MSRPSFDGNDLNTFNGSVGIYVQDIQGHESLPPKTVAQFVLAHANRSAIPYVQYPNRPITVKGVINGSSIADLDARVDAFKYFFLGTDKNLDIDYAGSIRRFIATVNTISINRPNGLLYAEFTIVFTCNYPFGQNTATTNAVNQSGRTNSSYTDAHTFLGTAPFQLPLWTLTLSDIISSSTNVCTNPGFEVDTSGWSSGGIGTFTRTTGQNHSGSAAGQMVNAASSPLSSPSANTYGWELFPISGLVAGQTYRVSLWVKGNAGGEAFRCRTLGGVDNVVSLTTSWQQVTFTFVATATTDQLYVWSTTASATWFIDDVSITQQASSTVSVGNANNGQQLNITRNWVINDVLVVDTVNRNVTVNGNAVAYTGAFPEFPPGAQQLYYADGFISRTLTELVTYYPMFL